METSEYTQLRRAKLRLHDKTGSVAPARSLTSAVHSCVFQPCVEGGMEAFDRCTVFDPCSKDSLLTSRWWQGLLPVAPRAGELASRCTLLQSYPNNTSGLLQYFLQVYPNNSSWFIQIFLPGLQQYFLKVYLNFSSRLTEIFPPGLPQYVLKAYRNISYRLTPIFPLGLPKYFLQVYPNTSYRLPQYFSRLTPIFPPVLP